ncbi:hypothetical protein N0B16_06380 [Chryseobacterium sp. GMJ5]|uniref:Lipoprotein n=1 Tax=Chryseobacterium gilvum TaxID=2976534 RepID=A0ABT2VY86_9FLAO|nr:hypothetical protein [Chryseobacterium gilvum]MCU7614059.1 hypothetical protein [Chryseobacterium gilvum]
MIKKLIPRLCLMLAVLLSLYSCRNDLFPENNTLQNPNASRFRMVKLKDIPNVEQFIHQQSGRADLQVPLSEASLTGKDLTVGVIEISTIVETVNEGETYYVFKIENLNSGDAVYNLEVKQADGIPVTAEIIEYDPQDGTTVDFQHFTGSISSYGLDGKAISTVNYNDGLGNCSPATGVPGGNNTSEGGGINPIDLPPPNGGWYNWEEGGSNNNTVPFSNVPGDCTDIILDNHGNTLEWYDHCNDVHYPNPNVHKTTTTGKIPNLSPDCNVEGAGVIITDPETPCEKTKTMLENPDANTKIESLYNKSKSEGEEAFMTAPDGTPGPIIQGDENSVKLGNTTGYASYSHNHPPKGVKIHSPGDIYQLFRLIANQPTGTAVDVSFGQMVATEVCAGGCPDGYLYINYLIRFNGTLDEAKAVSDRNYTKAQLDALKDDYEKFELNLRPKPGYSSQNGNFMSFKGLEEVFFNALDDMNIDKSKMTLQRIDKDGTVYNVTLGADGKPVETPCP